MDRAAIILERAEFQAIAYGLPLGARRRPELKARIAELSRQLAELNYSGL